jgi:hypothetical protein
MGYLRIDEIKEPEDLFLTKEFQDLSWGQRTWIRLKIAFFQTLSMW